MFSAPNILEYDGNRLAQYEFSARFRFRNKITGEPINVSAWGLQLRATSESGSPSFSYLMATMLQSTGPGTNDELICLAQTPRLAGLTDGSDADNRTFILWLSRAGSVGRKLLARVRMNIDPTPDGDVYRNGPLDPEVFVLEIDLGTGEYQGQLADPTAIYDGLYQMVTGRQKTDQATDFNQMANLPNPMESVLFTIAEPTVIDGETFLPGRYWKNSDGTIDRALTERVYPNNQA
ncbi:hypothetical protein ACFQ4C_18095 [Larkinella insperata]|uniref:Uncharacterized protein n=1 Tax=Larkinella insperata TaxID=332158 RepID=A0ABW3QA50_9BACT|nr:hypothetical protein [Larkinella insperata]